MLSLESLRRKDPTLAHLKDEELEQIRLAFYELAQLMFDDWKDQKFGSKFPIGSLTSNEDKHTL